MSVKTYLELSPDCNPVYITSEDAARKVQCNSFSASAISEYDYAFKFNYRVPTKNVSLSLLQIQDLINFYSIYLKENPSWSNGEGNLFQVEKLK